MNFVKFLGVGGTATAIHYAILILLVELNLATPAVASAIGYALSSIANYLLNYYFTFSSKANHGIASVKFMLVAGTGLVINTTLVYLMTEIASFYYLAAQLIATFIVLLWNYYIHKIWTYRSAKGD